MRIRRRKGVHSRITRLPTLSLPDMRSNRIYKVHMIDSIKSHQKYSAMSNGSLLHTASANTIL